MPANARSVKDSTNYPSDHDEGWDPVTAHGFPADYFVYDPTTMLLRKLGRVDAAGKVFMLAGVAVGLAVAAVGIELIPVAYRAVKWAFARQPSE